MEEIVVPGPSSHFLISLMVAGVGGQDRHEDGENGQLRRLDLEDGIWCGDEAKHEGDDNIQLVGPGST